MKQTMKETIKLLLPALIIFYFFVLIARNFNPFLLPNIEDRIFLALIPTLFLFVIIYLPEYIAKSRSKIVNNVLNFLKKVQQNKQLKTVVTNFFFFLLLVLLVDAYFLFLESFTVILAIITAFLGIITFWLNKHLLATEHEWIVDDRIYKIGFIAIILLNLFFTFNGFTDISINPDAQQWLGRGVNYFSYFFGEQIQQELISFYDLDFWELTNTPGLTSAFLVGLSLYLSYLFNFSTDPVFVARLPFALLSIVFIIVFYFLSQKFVDKKTSFFATVFLSLSPFFQFLSREIHLDFLLGFFIFLTVYFYYAYQEKHDNKNLILFSLFFGLAILTKVTALFLVPLIGFIEITKISKTKKINLKHYFIAAFVVLGLIVAAWPGLIQNPVEKSLDLVGYTGDISTSQTHRGFWFGTLGSLPFYYYAFILLIKLPLIFLAFLLLGSLRSLKKNYFLIPALFMILTSISTKMADRYLITVWPFLLLIIGTGFVTLTEFIRARFNLKMAKMLMALTLVFVLLNILIVVPNYGLYYNSLIGKTENAQNYIRFGWGEDSKKAAEFVNEKYGNASIAAFTYSYDTGYYSHGNTIAALHPGWEDQDLLLVSVSKRVLLHENHPVQKIINENEPIDVIFVQGIPMTEVYDLKNIN